MVTETDQLLPLSQAIEVIYRRYRVFISDFLPYSSSSSDG